MKHEVGDVVRIRKDLKRGCKYGDGAINLDGEMNKYFGRVARITGVEGYFVDCYYYKLDIDNGCWYWTDEMFEEKTFSKKDLKLNYIVVYNENILDDTEIKYLQSVIKPFKDKVMWIAKYNHCGDYVIHIELVDDEVCLPYFKDKRMYKGMEHGKEYTLKELGLEE